MVLFPHGHIPRSNKLLLQVPEAVRNLFVRGLCLSVEAEKKESPKQKRHVHPSIWCRQNTVLSTGLHLRWTYILQPSKSLDSLVPSNPSTYTKMARCFCFNQTLCILTNLACNFETGPLRYEFRGVLVEILTKLACTVFWSFSHRTNVIDGHAFPCFSHLHSMLSTWKQLGEPAPPSKFIQIWRE